MSLPVPNQTLGDWVWGYPLVVNPFSPRDSCSLLVRLVLCPGTLGLAFCLPGTCTLLVLTHAGSSVTRLGPHGEARQKCGLYLICGQSPANCCQISGELSLPFCGLFLGGDVVLGRVAPFASAVGTPFVSKGFFNTVKNIYCLSWMRSDKILEKIVLSSSWLEAG